MTALVFEARQGIFSFQDFINFRKFPMLSFFPFLFHFFLFIFHLIASLVKMIKKAERGEQDHKRHDWVSHLFPSEVYITIGCRRTIYVWQQILASFTRRLVAT